MDEDLMIFRADKADEHVMFIYDGAPSPQESCHSWPNSKLRKLPPSFHLCHLPVPILLNKLLVP